jgi:hypothetical protein
MTNVAIDLHYYPNAAGDSQNPDDHRKWIADNVGAINNVYHSQDGKVPVCCLEFGDACCGHVSPGGNAGCEAVATSAFEGWTHWNWTTWWNYTWAHDVINQGENAVNTGIVTAAHMQGV